jgi:sugar lactone lactonase YvrE
MRHLNTTRPASRRRISLLLPLAVGFAMAAAPATASLRSILVPGNAEFSPPGFAHRLQSPNAGQGAAAPELTVLASGLEQPKQVTVGPDGNIYVSCSGNAAATDPVASAAPTNQTGSVVRISPSGDVTPFLTGLRSQFYEGSSVGPAGIAFWNGALYVSQARYDTFNSPTGQLVSAPVLKVTSDGKARAFTSFNSVPYDLTTESTLDTDPYGATVGSDGLLYVSDGGDNGIWRVQENGDTSLLIQFPGNPVVTGITAVPSKIPAHAIAAQKKSALVATLFGNGMSGFSNGRVETVDAQGAHNLVPAGVITMPIGAAYSPSGNLYVLQFSTVNPNPGPPFVAGTGAIWSVTPNGTATKVLGDLTFPTGITFSHDGTAYVTNNGLMPAAGPVTGQLVKVTGLL